MDERRIDLVFKGGGIKGIALVGALAALEERGMAPGRVVGTSAGAILASLVAAGYSAAELKEIFLRFDFRQLRDRDGAGRAPVLGPAINLLRFQGMYQGDAMHRTMRDLLAVKGVHTFGDLRRRRPGTAIWEEAAQVVAADLTERRLLVLPRDAHLLGIDPEALEVALTVRMSAGLPLVFAPVRFHNPETGREHLIVDGGLLSNFPVWVAATLQNTSNPVLGLRLTGDQAGPGARGRGLRATVGFVASLARTALEAHDRHRLDALHSLDAERDIDVIDIPTLGVGAAAFDLPRARKLDLYDAGRAAVHRFFAAESPVAAAPNPGGFLPAPRALPVLAAGGFAA